MKILAVLLGLVCGNAIAGDWHLLTKSQVGEVSIQHGLTFKACEFARKRLLGLPATKAEQKAHEERYRRIQAECDKQKDPRILSSCGVFSDARYVQPSDIVYAECFK